MKLFLLRFRTLKLLLIEEKQWGIVPFIELLHRSRTPRDVALEMFAMMEGKKETLEYSHQVNCHANKGTQDFEALSSD